MRELGHRPEPHHRGSPFQAVGRPKCPIKVRTVALTPLQVHQPLLEADQELTCLFIKHLTKSVVRTAAQFPILDPLCINI